MELEKILQNVESRLVQAGHALWQPDAKAAMRDEADLLSDDLRKRHEALQKAKAEQTFLQRNIGENENAAQVLTGHIQTCLTCGHGDQAWTFAMKLDQIRQALAADRARLPKLEQVCWSLKFQIRQMERQLARLHEKVYPASAEQSRN
jgi:hypothetical protein